MSLSSIAEAAKDIENRFAHKRILFIPSESYCAATITVIEGLRELGFRVMTPYKPNINSWGWDDCVIGAENFRENPGCQVDFVISNLHWGTRWDYYERFGVQDHFKVLIDGDDSRHGSAWLERYNGWSKVYTKPRPQEEDFATSSPAPGSASSSASLRLQQPYRWMEPLGDYKPDLVFSAQKAHDDLESMYIPFGVHNEYSLCTSRASQRDIAVCNIPGDGPSRISLTHFLDTNKHKLPSPMHNTPAKGEWRRPFWAIEDETMFDLMAHDPNIHSWSRWRIYQEYYRVLANSSILVYPGVFDDIPQYQSKREFEAMAAGCLVLFANPTIDMSDYDYLERFDRLVWRSYYELAQKIQFFHDKPAILDGVAARLRQMAMRYLTPSAIARYVLLEVSKRI